MIQWVDWSPVASLSGKGVHPAVTSPVCFCCCLFYFTAAGVDFGNLAKKKEKKKKKNGDEEAFK